ncbi:10562_t:CDS:2, partial [Racocetra fulgida]
MLNRLTRLEKLNINQISFRVFFPSENISRRDSSPSIRVMFVNSASLRIIVVRVSLIERFKKIVASEDFLPLKKCFLPSAFIQAEKDENRF